MSNRTVTQLGAIVLMVPLMVPLSAQNQIVKGNTYADTVEVGVRTLTLIGAGLREWWWLRRLHDGRVCREPHLRSADADLDGMGQNPSVSICSATSTRKVWLPRSKRLLRRTCRPTPLLGLRSQIDTFRGYFKKDLEKGDSMEMTYVPGVGTALMQNREQQGVTVPDKGFADILWASFFSSETCCSGLKKQIFEHCSR